MKRSDEACLLAVRHGNPRAARARPCARGASGAAGSVQQVRRAGRIARQRYRDECTAAARAVQGRGGVAKAGKKRLRCERRGWFDRGLGELRACAIEPLALRVGV